MKKQNKLKLVIISLCLAGLVAAAVVTANQISLDSPASLPSDI